MPNSYARQQYVFLQEEATYGVIPASVAGGPVTLAGTNACKIINCTMNAPVGSITRPDKTGLRSRAPGSPGRRVGSYSMSMSLAPGSGPGVVPDNNPGLVAAFGQAATIVPSTSATYVLSDIVKSFTLWDFRDPSSLNQRVGVGCLVANLSLGLGGDFVEVGIDGPLLNVLESEEYVSVANGDVGRGGLTSTGQAAYPTRPATPVTNGNMIPGYKGSLLVDSQALGEFQTGRIVLSTGNLLRPAWGTDYFTVPIGGSRVATFEFTGFDSDSAAMKNVRAKAKLQTPVDIVMTCGVAVGARCEITLRQVQLAGPTISESGEEFMTSVGSSAASCVLATPNEFQLKYF